MTPLPVLLVGSGRRIRNNFVPVLSLLENDLQPLGLWSRSPEHAHDAAAPWRIPVVDDLAGAVPEARVVVVSVKLGAVPSVLARICRAPVSDVTLVIDTPTLPLSRLAAVRLLRRFERVIVAEDYMNFPQWELVRTAIDAGLIGSPQSIELRHSGYRYHGLALIRSMLGFPQVRSARSGVAARSRTFELSFPDSVRATIFEPYDQGRASTTVVGELGVISDSLARPASARSFHRVELTGQKEPDGFRLGDFRLELPELDVLMRSPGAANSLFNGLKSYGLKTVLSSIWEPNINRAYAYQQGIYDHLVTTLLRRALSARAVPVFRPPALGRLAS